MPGDAMRHHGDSVQVHLGTPDPEPQPVEESPDAVEEPVADEDEDETTEAEEQGQ